MVPATLYRPHVFVKDSLLDQPCTICREVAPQAQFFEKPLP